MSTQVTSQLTSSRFANMCAANWFLHLYVFSMIPLLYVQSRQLGADGTVVVWAVAAFAIGMVLPGPFGAHLMERRSRKQVFLKAMVAIGLLPTFGYVNVCNPEWIVVLHGFQGMAFGVAQTALGTTLVNDLLLSKERNAGDIIYAWAGRLGIPLGLALGFVLLQLFTLAHAYWWALAACGMAFLLVAQTPVPLKAPVKVPLLTCDRFFIPKSFPLVITMFAAPWAMGRVVGAGVDVTGCVCLTAGTLITFLTHLLVRHRVGQNGAVSVGYTILMVAFALIGAPGLYTTYAAYVLLGIGMGTVSSRHLIGWLTSAEHCQRGTAQNTYMISWRMAFTLGFVFSALNGMGSIAGDFVLTIVSLLLYLFWAGRRVAKSA